MKKIIVAVKCIVMLLPLWIIWNSTANHFDGYADGEAPYYVWNREECAKKLEVTYDVVILGDSTSNGAYLPEFLSDQSLNLALGGTTPAENYYVLYNYLQNNEAPKVCYISYADAHLVAEDCYWDRTVYFHLLGFQQAKEIYDRAVFYQEESITSAGGYQKLVEEYLWWPGQYMPSLLNSGINGRREQFKMSYDNVDLHRGAYITRGGYENGTTSENDNETFVINPLFDEYYKKTIELCNQYHIQVRLVKLPVSPSYRYQQSYIEGFDSYYDALKNTYPGITVDWIKDGFDQYDFVDIHHMNYHGAKKFSEQIKNMYPQDFQTNTLDDNKVRAVLDYAEKSPRLDDLLDYAAFIKYNVVVAVRETSDIQALTDKYADFVIENTLENGMQIFLFNFSNRNIAEYVDESTCYIEDGQIGEIKIERTGQGIYTISYPNTEPYTVVDGMQIDVGAVLYNEVPMLTKEFYYRNHEFNQVISK